VPQQPDADQPFFTRTYSTVSGKPSDPERALEEVWDEKAREYRATKVVAE